LLRVAIAARTVAAIAAQTVAVTASILEDAAAEAASDAAAAAVDTADAAAAASARADGTFLHPSTLRLRAKIVAVTGARTVEQTAEANVADAAIQIAVALKIAARGVISIIAVLTLRVLPLPLIPPRNLLCCLASRSRSIASAQCR
jgi:hypothetical protein